MIPSKYWGRSVSVYFVLFTSNSITTKTETDMMIPQCSNLEYDGTEYHEIAWHHMDKQMTLQSEGLASGTHAKRMRSKKHEPIKLTFRQTWTTWE